MYSKVNSRKFTVKHWLKSFRISSLVLSIRNKSHVCRWSSFQKPSTHNFPRSHIFEILSTLIGWIGTWSSEILLLFAEDKYHKSTSFTIYAIMFECRLNKCHHYTMVLTVSTANMFRILHGSEILQKFIQVTIHLPYHYYYYHHHHYLSDSILCVCTIYITFCYAYN